MRPIRLIAACLFTLLATQASADSFVPDPAFGVNGVATYEWSPFYAYQYNAANVWMAVQNNGKLVVATQLRNGNSEILWTHWFEPSGQPTTPAPGGGPYTPSAYFSQGAGLVTNWDGSIGLLGTRTIDAGDSDFRLLRTFSNGESGYQGCAGGFVQDVAFDVGPAGQRQDIPRAMVLDGEGRTYVVGNANAGDGRSVLAIARIGRYCGVETQYGNNGRVTTAIGSSRTVRPHVAILDAQNRLLVGGGITTDGGANAPGRCFISRFTDAGRLDGSFAGTGTYQISNFTDYSGTFSCKVTGLATDSGGRIYVLGRWTVKTGTDERRNSFHMRLNPGGSRDNAYGELIAGGLNGNLDIEVADLAMFEADGYVARVGSNINYASGGSARGFITGNRLATGTGSDGPFAAAPVPGRSTAYHRIVKIDDDTFYVLATSGPDYMKHHKTHVVRYRRASTLPPSDRIFFNGFEP